MTKYLFILSFLILSSTTYAQNYKYGKVSKSEVAQKQHDKEPDANAAVLYKYQRTYYDYKPNSGFFVVTEYHERIKIYNKDGFDWATHKISAYKGGYEENVSGVRGVSYNLENGKIKETKLDRKDIYENEASKYRELTTFTMPAVKEGTVIEYEYKKISDRITTSMDRINLQYTIPIDKLNISVTIPEYLNFGVYNNPKAAFYAKINQGTKPFKRSFSNNQRNSSYGGKVVSHSTSNSVLDYMQNTYEIDQEDIPALKTESHVDYMENYAAFLDWELKFTKFPNSPIDNYSQTWEGVSKSIYNDSGFNTELRNQRFFDDDIDALLGTLTNQEQKMNKIFNFVKQKMTWNDYVGYIAENGLRDAYEEGTGNTGDINLLLVSMLKYANIDANPVLVSTVSNGTPLFPTKNGFNYLIAAAKIGDNVILMDASDPLAIPGELPKRARNWQGRLIREDGTSEWVNLQPLYFSENKTRLNVQLAEDGISGKYFNNLDALYARNFRLNHGNLSDATANLESGLSNYSISEVKIENFEKLGESIQNTYEFNTQSGQDVIGDKIYVKPMLFNVTSENPFKAETRTLPVYFDFPMKKHHQVNMLIPEGYEVESLPQSAIVQLKDAAGEFKYLVKHMNNVIRIESEVNLAQTIFAATDYEYIQKFYDNIIKKQNESIVLKKISADGLEERADSGR